MARTADDYLEMLFGLLPPGIIWPRDPESVLGKALMTWAEGLAATDARAEDLVREANPAQAFELLAEWETECGLPDECSELTATLAERREAVVAKLSHAGGQSPAYFVGLAKALGYEVEVEEFRPFRAGHSAAGDPDYDEAWALAWRVRAPEQTVRYFRAGQGCAGEPLAKWGNEKLECVVGQAKPAHTTLLFAYGE